MTNDSCILTTKDHSILEVLLERGLEQDDPLVPLLRRKLGGARVVLRANIPADVATLNSRVSYHLDDGVSRVRVISHAEIEDREGLFLPITTSPGLALLGLSCGQSIALFDPLDGQKTVTLDHVLYQPEAPRLHLVRRQAAMQPVPRRPGHEDDDPGPSAA